jgi:Bacterial archaeo-eukaryotic release factor family 7
MSLLAKHELRELIESPGPWCVSIYMPAHRAGAETQQDPIRLKNLLNEAEEQLVAARLRSPEARDLLEPGRRLLIDSAFWRGQGDGLALFLTAEADRHYRLPLSFDSLVVVGPRFQIKPLLPLLTADAEFYILALSQDEVRLLYGTRYSISEVDIETMPQGLSDALRYDDPQKQLQFHTGTAAPGAGKRAAIYHGHGVGSNDVKPNLLRYFQEVAASLHPVLREERAPMVLAGVDYLLPIYREASSYPHLVDAQVTGNPEGLSLWELHARGWELLRPHFDAARELALARYQQLAGSGSSQASTNLQDVLLAAHGGLVENLFVALGVQQWGTFDAATHRVEIHEAAQPGDVDLLDLAAAYTFVNGGVVYARPPEDMPDSAALAAVLRYETP